MSESPLDDIRMGEICHQWAEHNKIPSRFVSVTGSTNDLAKEEAFEAAAEDGLKLYFTDQQTKGRGRGSNTWVDARPGSGLLSSWSFALQDPPQPLLTPRIGLGLFRAAMASWPFLEWSLKAPNDLYLNDRKVAGLLVETLTQGVDVRLIVGLGLNVLQAPAAIKNSTCLVDELPTGVPLQGDEWAVFLDRWLFELTAAIMRPDEPLSSSERESLKHALNLLPSEEGSITDVRPDGGLDRNGKITHWMDL
jgi:BirA family biotin operon repressor/biotin-[acetyl-CoA-carboxylase] ligase